MIEMGTIQAVLLAFGSTLLLAPATLYGLRRFQVVDYPNARSSHVRPVPRGGGLAPALGMIVALTATSALASFDRTALLIACVGFGLIGLVEDLWGLPPFPRLILQSFVALAALPSLLAERGGFSPGQLAFGMLVVFWMVAYANAFNFMDGINGISAAQVLVAGFAWSTIGWLVDDTILIGSGLIGAVAALAFVPFNFPRAHVFLGDTGSYFFGGWLAAVAVVALRHGLAPEAVLAPLTLYVADTGTTLVRRVLGGEEWQLPHRDHTYQRLVRAGWSHTKTTLVIGAVMLGCSSLGLLALSGSLVLRFCGDVLLVAALIFYATMPNRLRRTEELAA